MNNKPVYTFKVDLETHKVLDSDFVSFMDRCLASGVDFDVNVCDANGFGYVPINMAINIYISDCRKDENDRCIANPFRDENFGEYLKQFVENFLDYYLNRSKMMNDRNYYQFDVFKGGFVCKTFIPITFIDKDLYNEYLGLGPDYLVGAKGITNEVLFKYILPAYYCNLIYDDLTDNEKYSNLADFKIGLA